MFLIWYRNQLLLMVLGCPPCPPSKRPLGRSMPLVTCWREYVLIGEYNCMRDNRAANHTRAIGMVKLCQVGGAEIQLTFGAVLQPLLNTLICSESSSRHGLLRI